MRPAEIAQALFLGWKLERSEAKRLALQYTTDFDYGTQTADEIAEMIATQNELERVDETPSEEPIEEQLQAVPPPHKEEDAGEEGDDDALEEEDAFDEDEEEEDEL